MNRNQKLNRDIYVGVCGPISLADNFRKAGFTQERINELLDQFNTRIEASNFYYQDDIETLANQMLRENGLGHIVDREEMDSTVCDIKEAQKRGKNIEVGSVFKKNTREGD
jgi:hypothetical protein